MSEAILNFVSHVTETFANFIFFIYVIVYFVQLQLSTNVLPPRVEVREHSVEKFLMKCFAEKLGTIEEENVGINREISNKRRGHFS